MLCLVYGTIASKTVHKHAKKNLANIQPYWPHAWSITCISRPLRIILCFLKKSGILYKMLLLTMLQWETKAHVVETLLENDTFQCLTFCSFSFASSINYSLIPLPYPPTGDLVCSVLEIEKSTFSGGEESGMFPRC